VSESNPRLAPRSAGAVADLELLRAARTAPDEADAEAVWSVVDRLRGLASLRPARPSAFERSVPVRLDPVDPADRLDR